MFRHFGEVWAVDREREMTGFVREKAAAARIGHIHDMVSDAEDFAAEAESFELVAIGNAFHPAAARDGGRQRSPLAAA